MASDVTDGQSGTAKEAKRHDIWGHYCACFQCAVVAPVIRSVPVLQCSVLYHHAPALADGVTMRHGSVASYLIAGVHNDNGLPPYSTGCIPVGVAMTLKLSIVYE